MARSYEYVIHGRPLSGGSSLPRQKTLSSTRDLYQQSNLRNQYHTSISPTDYVESPKSLPEHRIPSPTTPRLPPTPPTGEDGEGGDEEEVKQRSQLALDDGDAANLPSLPVTPVHQHSPPTPDRTPPRGQVKLPLRPLLAVRPSIASTQAESFSTARENVYSDDESDHFFLAQSPNPASPTLPLELPSLDGHVHEHDIEEASVVARDEQPRGMHDELVPSSSPPPAEDETQVGQHTTHLAHATPATQFGFENLSDQAEAVFAAPEGETVTLPKDHPSASARISTFYDEVTAPRTEAPVKDTSLRDRVQAIKQIHNTASTEAFANVIGWNDGGLHRNAGITVDTHRWSGLSNTSTVEAYVVDSPIQPRKRGTLRKVIKNESLRSTSSPIPESLHSTSDASHRLVHKKQKLNNENRWSISSEISNRSMSCGSSPAWLKQEVIKVAVVPERNASLHTSASSSRRHSRSIAGNPAHPALGMPHRKRAGPDAKDKPHADTHPFQVPATSTPMSASISRNDSRANSISSHPFSIQREQAEKDLRNTLERMETERLSASLRRSSQQSSSPTPGSRPLEQMPEAFIEPVATGTDRSRKDSGAAVSARSRQKSVTINMNDVDPGTKEWAELRPTNVNGTPFSQASMLSTSPEIVEAKAVSFFPHNNQSLQVIEPTRLSGAAAIRVLREQGLNRAHTLPARTEDLTTPRASHQFLLIEQNEVVSPLRNPRKPPEPPQLQVSVIPPALMSVRDYQLGATPDTSPAKPRNMSARRRPSLQGRGRSESFIKSLSRNMSLRNTKNLKQDQELDSTSNPFWRPEAFWHDDDYRRRMQQDRDREPEVYDDSTDKTETSTIVKRAPVVQDSSPRLLRSNTIATGPMSLVHKMSERRKQRRLVHEHIAVQQALVRQTSYSSLQRLHVGNKLLGLPPLRMTSLNTRVRRLSSLREKVAIARERKEERRRELKREKLRRSIGPEVISQGDSRFFAATFVEHTGGTKAGSPEAIGDMLEQARAEEVAGRRGLRL